MRNKELRENAGLSRGLLYALATIAGLSVANLYYNQPLLHVMGPDLGCGEAQTARIALLTQVGYALGLFFIVPLADLYNRRRIITADLGLLVIALLAMALAPTVGVAWGASVVIGICSVVPQIFVPLAAQYSTPEEKGRNVGIVVSGLLTGILASRVVSGAVGELWGWRTMYYVAAGLMVLSAGVMLRVLPPSESNFRGSYGALMRSLVSLLRTYPALRVYALRAGLAFGSFMGLWSVLAFRMARAPFFAGSDEVGALGLCGVAGALTASFIGRLTGRIGVRRLSVVGALMHLVAWGLFFIADDTYAGLIAGILVLDIGMQCVQLGNQTRMFALCPSASNRMNTIFMTAYFIGGSLGTFVSGSAWVAGGWPGVVLAGAVFSLLSLCCTCCSRY